MRHFPTVFRCIVFLKQMKRFLQIVAVLAITLLSVQPAIAGLTCDLGAPAGLTCAPHCPMAGSHVSKDCQKPLHASRTGCQQESCRFGWPQAVVRSTQIAKTKAIAAPFFLALPTAAPAKASASTAPPPSDLAAASPPRHILFRVFRI
jgi:hypothetical protein